MDVQGELLIASQLDAQMNERIGAQVCGVRVAAVEPGFPQTLPVGARVFFATPYRAGGFNFPARPAWVDRIDWMQLTTAGVDGYPPWYFEVSRVTASRGPTAMPVAEFALAAMLAHAKKLPDIWMAEASQWQARPLGTLHGATLGILGYGAIGRTLARLGLALGMHVIVHRRTVAPIDDAGVASVSLRALMERSDHLVIAAAATPQTHHIIGAAALSHAKPGMHVVNVARGSLIDQDALIRSIDSGRVAMASLDVCEPEPLPHGHTLYSHPKVRLSPHLSAYDAALRDRLADGFIDNLKRYLRGDPLLGQVDRQRGY